MEKKNLESAWRYLWRHPLFSSLNIFGLALGISTCWIIFRMVDYEFSYENEVPGKENIYRVASGFIFDEKESYNGGVSLPVYQALREKASGLEYVAPLLGKWSKSVEVNSKIGKPAFYDEPTGVTATDSSYFTIVPYHWLAGNKSQAFNGPKNVVLTESRAAKYFPGKTANEILGNTLTYYSDEDTTQRTITGIVADLKGPTEFTAQEFCSLPVVAYPLGEWTNTNGSDKLYLRLKQGVNPASVLSQIQSMVEEKVKEFNAQNKDHFEFKRWFLMIPLRESHFSTYIEEYDNRKVSRNVLSGLIGIGVFLLIIACINYINMSVASMPHRSKEIGVRKTLGSTHSQLMTRFLMETLLATVLAAVLALAFGLTGFWLLKDIIPPGITPFGNPWHLVTFLVAVSVVVTLLAGLYPGWLITKVKTIHVFRRFVSGMGRRHRFSLQKTLIVFQFVIALVFIMGAIIVGDQLHYTLRGDMGFDREAVIISEVPWKFAGDKKYENKQFPLFSELKRIPGVQNIALGSPPMGFGYSSSSYDYTSEGRPTVTREIFRKRVDTGYIRLYGIPLVAGRNLRPSDTTNEFVINERAVQAFGFRSPEESLGKMIGRPEQKFPIVGVVRDFHTQNFYKTIDPMLFESRKNNLNAFNIKLAAGSPSTWQKTIKAVENEWNRFYPPGTFKYHFYDETLEEIYANELHLAKLINIATAIAILIGCMGLFGLSAYTAFQRTKEIGIRKVLGASAAVIVRLLSREYLGLIVIAIIIATPISWWAMDKWLQNFAYRIEISWWMFAMAGLAGIVVAGITVSFQSIKAALTNPVDTLRTE